MIRSIISVVAGYAAMVIIVVITSVFAGALLLGSPGIVTPTYIITNLIFGLVAPIVGGYVTAKLAPKNMMQHVQILAGLVIVLGLLSATQPLNGQPVWYPWVIMLIGAIGTLIGGSIVKSSQNKN